MEDIDKKDSMGESYISSYFNKEIDMLTIYAR